MARVSLVNRRLVALKAAWDAGPKTEAAIVELAAQYRTTSRCIRQTLASIGLIETGVTCTGRNPEIARQLEAAMRGEYPKGYPFTPVAGSSLGWVT